MCLFMLSFLVHGGPQLGRLRSPRQGNNMLGSMVSAPDAESGSDDERLLQIGRRMRKFHADPWKVEYVS